MTSTAPILPPSQETNWQPVTVEANIAKALAETAGMTMTDKILWFYHQVQAR